MVRVETIGDCTLYLGDCLEILPTLPRVDAVITDPPYGINYCHGTGGIGGISGGRALALNVKKRGHCRKIFGDNTPFDPCPLLSIGADFVLMWGADHYRQRLPEGGTFIAWDKSLGKGPKDDFADAEFAWTNIKVKRNVIRLLWKGVCQEEGMVEVNKQRFHPTQKPTLLMFKCLSFFSGCSNVLDPYMGSGSTGVACVKGGVRFIGIELDEKYFDIACRRIEQEVRKVGSRLPGLRPTDRQPAAQLPLTLTLKA